MRFPLQPRRERGDADTPAPGLVDIIEHILSGVPPAHEHAVEDAEAAAHRVAHEAAQRAALLSGSLALPPGPIGLLTILPDLYLIWKVQRQMVADIFALHGRSAELTPHNIVYCLFRHLASHVVRDVAVRAGQRIATGTLASGVLRSTAAAVGIHITKRTAGSAASRWVPLAGAFAVGAYAYWDTLQVAKAAQRLLAGGSAPKERDVEGELVVEPVHAP